MVKKLIPPKGIKRKNQGGYGLLDYVCPDDSQEGDYQNLFDNLFKSQINFEEESDGESSDGDDSSDEVLQDEGTATQHDESEIAASSSRVVPLSNLCDDPDVNKYAFSILWLKYLKWILVKFSPATCISFRTCMMKLVEA